MTSYTTVINGTAVAALVDGVNAFTSAVDVTLTATAEAPVAKVQEANFTAAGRVLFMPDARRLSLGGPPMLVINKGTNLFSLKTNDGLTKFSDVGVGERYFVYLQDNSTQGGVWTAEQIGIGSASNIAAALAGFGLTANGSQLDVNTAALAGNGLSRNVGTGVLDVNVDGASLEINADVLRVKDGGITNAKIATATITSDKLAAGVGTVQKFSNEVNGLTSSGTLVVSTPGVPATNARFNRYIQVVEETAGGAASDTTLDFDFTDRNNFDINSSTPAATITPASNGNQTVTYGQPLIDYTPVAPAFGPNIETASNSATGQLNYILPIAGIASGTSISLQSRSINYGGATAFYPAQTALTESAPTSPTVYTGIANDTNSVYTKLSGTKFLRATSNSTATQLKLESFSLSSSGNFTSIGTLTISLTINGTSYAVCPIDASTALIVYRDATATTLRARVITVPDAANPTSGSEQTTTVTAFTDPRLCQIDTAKFVVTYSSSTVVYAMCMTISAGTLTFGAEQTLDTAPSSIQNYNVAALGTNSFAALFLNFNAAGPVRAAREVTATISGTTITVQATNTLGDSVGGTNQGNIIRLSATRTAVFYYAAAAGGPTVAIRDYTTIASPTTASSSGLAAVGTRGQASLGFDSTLSLVFVYYGLSSSTQAQTYIFNYSGSSLNTLSVTQDLGWDITASTNIWNTTDLGSAIEGNSGYVRITDFKQDATGGSALSSAGTAANAFDDNTATVCSAGVNGWVGYDLTTGKIVRIVGIRVNVAGSYNLSFEAASDSVFTTPVVTHTWSGILSASQIYWFMLSSPSSALRYYRVRETGGATFTVQDLYFNLGLTVRAQSAYVDFANTNPITTGNWTLEGPAFTNLNVAAAANDSSELMITQNPSQINAATWEDLDSLSATSVSYMKRIPTPYIVGRGSPVSSANIYNSLSGYPLFATSATTLTASNSICKLTTNRYLIVYSDDADSNKLKAVLVGRSGNTLSVLSTLQIDGVSSSGLGIVPINSNQALLTWLSGGLGHAVVVSSISDSLAISTTYNITSVNAGNSFLAMIDATHALYCARINDTGKTQAQVLTIVGSVITAGTPVDVVTTTSAMVTCALVDVGKAVIAYGDATGTMFKAVVATINTGAGTISLGTPATIDGANNPASGCLHGGQVATNKMMISYGYLASGTTSRYRILTVSGTTVTVGAETAYVDTSNQVFLCPVNSTTFLGCNRAVTPTSIYMLKTDGTSVFVAGKSIAPDGLLTQSSPSSIYGPLISDGDDILVTGLPSQGYFRIELSQYGAASPVFAFSFNARTEWRVWDYGVGAYRSIASSLASVHGGVDGNWYYKDATDVWVAASPNTQRGALAQAFAVQKNRYPLLAYANLTDANWNSFGWTKSATSTIDVAVFFDAVGSNIDQMTFNYTSRSQWNAMSEDSYRRNLEIETQVTVTKLTGGLSNIKANVFYVT